MAARTIALRSLLRRKRRAAMIGVLVVLGTMLIVVGETFSLSVKHASRSSIVEHFTGDLIIYAARSKEKPSPFSFTTPLPPLPEPEKISAWCAANPLVRAHVAIAQNYGLISAEKNGRKTDIPFFFYAVDPAQYRAAFPGIAREAASFFGSAQSGVVISSFQRRNFSENYSVDLNAGDPVTLLSISDGGSVNAVPSTITGIYEPQFYTNVFNYINFVDMATYAQLYNFTGVDAASLPDGVRFALATETDDDIFALAGGTETVATEALVARELNGYAMIAVKLTDPQQAAAFTTQLAALDLGTATAPWNEASGFFAYIASIIQAVVYGATLLIFLIVTFILMNTLIIGVLERTAEIGTLRALGAEKSFVTALFLWESFLLNGTAALVGMIISVVVIGVASAGSGLILPDIVMQYLTGGEPLRIMPDIRPFIEAAILVSAVSGAAVLYPVHTATAITPLSAMNTR